MIQDKVIFIIPGFRQTPTDKAYIKISKILEMEGYFPILINIPWKNSTISQNTKYFLEEYKKVKSKKKYILGFSYGAMIAFIASTKVTSAGLILCSLSPYFKEDLPKIKNRAISKLTRQRYQDFSRLNSLRLVQKIKAKQILMLYGRQENRDLIRRVRETFGALDSLDKKLFSIKNAQHNIGHKSYLLTIREATKYFT